MTDFDDLIAPACIARHTFEVPNMARTTVLTFAPMHADNPAFLDAAMRKELEGAGDPQGLDLLRQDADRIVRWCSPTLTIDGVDRTADVAAFFSRLIDLAPTTYTTITHAVAAASKLAVVDVEPVVGNSPPA